MSLLLLLALLMPHTCDAIRPTMMMVLRQGQLSTMPTIRNAPLTKTAYRMAPSDDANGSSDDSTIKGSLINDSDATPEGYLSSDINKIGDNKQLRVLLYISFALLPCLLLVPFFLNREFVPPTDF